MSYIFRLLKIDRLQKEEEEGLAGGILISPEPISLRIQKSGLMVFDYVQIDSVCWRNKDCEQQLLIA